MLYEVITITTDGTSALAYNTAETTIALSQFQAEGGSASDNCSIKSISYQDSAPMGICPVVVNRTFRVTDNCDNVTIV